MDQAEYRGRETGARFDVNGGGGVPPGLPVGGGLQSQKQQQQEPAKAGDGTRVSQKQEEFSQVVEKPKPVIMAAGKRIPMIKFPNRRAGETQGTKAGSMSLFAFLTFSLAIEIGPNYCLCEYW